MKQEEEKLKREVEKFYKDKKTKETSSLQQEADDFLELYKEGLNGYTYLVEPDTDEKS